jgi:ATP/maltotriose-dependent transcriptional regulator MalT
LNPHCHFPRRLAIAGALLGLAAASAAAGTRYYQDKIYQRGREEPIVSQVTQDTIEEVKAGQAAFNPRAIVKIEYAGAPQSYRDAEMHRETGRYEEAIVRYETTLRNLAADDERAFWIAPQCRYYIAECYRSLGEYDKAQTAYQALLSEHPKTRFKPDALLGLGRTAFEAGKPDFAYRRFDELEKLAQQLDWQQWLYEAYVWKARALHAKKRYDDALGYVRKVLSADPRKFEDHIVQARTEEALIYTAQEKYDKAIELLEKQVDRLSARVAEEMEGVSGQTRYQRMEAQCKNALGDCYLALHKKSKDKKHLQEALLAFLWNVTLHPNLPERNEAVKKAADCFQQLGEEKRASELRDELGGEKSAS